LLAEATDVADVQFIREVVKIADRLFLEFSSVYRELRGAEWPLGGPIRGDKNRGTTCIGR
jgi:hypothetical protein